VPGAYTVRVTAGGATAESALQVLEDPRIEVDPAVRAAWTSTLLELAELGRRARELASRAQARVERMEGDAGGGPALAKARDLARETGELRSRLESLRDAAEGWVGPLSADQEGQRSFLSGMLETLGAELEAAATPGGG
jgi:hypothetical protein